VHSEQRQKTRDHYAPMKRLQVKSNQRKRPRAKSRHQLEQKKVGKLCKAYEH